MEIRFILLFLPGVCLHYFSPSPLYYRKGCHWTYILPVSVCSSSSETMMMVEVSDISSQKHDLFFPIKQLWLFCKMFDYTVILRKEEFTHNYKTYKQDTTKCEV